MEWLKFKKKLFGGREKENPMAEIERLIKDFAGLWYASGSERGGKPTDTLLQNMLGKKKQILTEKILDISGADKDNAARVEKEIMNFCSAPENFPEMSEDNFRDFIKDFTEEMQDIFANVSNSRFLKPRDE